MKPLILAAFAALALNAQSPAKPATPPTPAPAAQASAPAIPESMKTDWWKKLALLEDAEAQNGIPQKRQALNDARAKIEAFCNANGTVTSADPDGGPTCALKPPAPEPAAPDPKSSRNQR